MAPVDLEFGALLELVARHPRRLDVRDPIIDLGLQSTQERDALLLHWVRFERQRVEGVA
jgi:hypothetical protein